MDVAGPAGDIGAKAPPAAPRRDREKLALLPMELLSTSPPGAGVGRVSPPVPNEYRLKLWVAPAPTVRNSPMLPNSRLLRPCAAHCAARPTTIAAAAMIRNESEADSRSITLLSF